MRERYLHVNDRVYDAVEEIAEYIVSLSTPEHARRYTRQILDEIRELAHYADAIPESQYEVAKRYSPYAKILTTKNKRWSIIFHTDDHFVYVEEIRPSSMVTH